MKFISVVIPVKDEELNIRPLVERLIHIADINGLTIDIIFVDDGSTDHTWKKICESNRADGRVKGIRLIKNFGQHPAVGTGVQYASGDTIVVMDADLQDPPELISALSQKLGEGYDIVYAKKIKEDVNAPKKIFSWLFNITMSATTPRTMVMTNSMFSAMTKQSAEKIRKWNKSFNYFPGVISSLGLRQGYVPFKRPGRSHGETNYSLRRRFLLAREALFLYGSASRLIATASSTILIAGGSTTWLLAANGFLFLAAICLVATIVIMGIIWITITTRYIVLQNRAVEKPAVREVIGL